LIILMREKREFEQGERWNKDERKG
jgi:hypothetical protein